ncbi:aspartokinase [Rheinheimera sp. A13L]|uniref:amino acid kinase family protein n=1 Tax=Rheinheimera sp. A13L TaxID=506534 RepID=UPI0002125737|nr:aspartokinase [Rheinheimera sp. A13L]EGM76568.1 aspartokinase [Rheinheimera sp. A13L]
MIESIQDLQEININDYAADEICLLNNEKSISDKRQKNIVVHKFGGSSLATSERLHAVADTLVRQKETSSIVVVSAPGDVTDFLLELIDSVNDPIIFERNLRELSWNLSSLVNQTLQPASAEKLTNKLNLWMSEVPFKIKAQMSNEVLAIGELLSCHLLANLLHDRGFKSKAIDARDFLYLNVQVGEDAQVNWRRSEELLKPLISNGFQIITGFIARDQFGNSINLGRNGSDFSATIVGRLLDASIVQIWTDVEAIFSADPRKVPSARAYRQVPWELAVRLAELGNPVLHPKTFIPLQGRSVELVVRSSFEPEKTGSSICRQYSPEVQFVTDLDEVKLVTVLPGNRIRAEQVASALQFIVYAVPGTNGEQWIVSEKNLGALLHFLNSQNVSSTVASEQFYSVAWVKPVIGHYRELSQQVRDWLNCQRPLYSFNDDNISLWLFPSRLTTAELSELHQLLLSGILENFNMKR